MKEGVVYMNSSLHFARLVQRNDFSQQRERVEFVVALNEATVFTPRCNLLRDHPELAKCHPIPAETETVVRLKDRSDAKK